MCGIKLIRRMKNNACWTDKVKGTMGKEKGIQEDDSWKNEAPV